LDPLTQASDFANLRDPNTAFEREEMAVGQAQSQPIEPVTLYPDLVTQAPDPGKVNEANQMPMEGILNMDVLRRNLRKAGVR
jgi:hypothetical protein